MFTTFSSPKRHPAHHFATHGTVAGWCFICQEWLPPMAGKKQKKYDDDELAQDIALAQLTLTEIAEKHGLCFSMVQKIATGKARPEVGAMVDGITEAMVSQARRRVVVYADKALGTLNTLSAARLGDIGRKAAVDLLKYSLGDPSRTEVSVEQNQFKSLKPSTYAKIAELEGGPDDD